MPRNNAPQARRDSAYFLDGRTYLHIKDLPWSTGPAWRAGSGRDRCFIVEPLGIAKGERARAELAGAKVRMLSALVEPCDFFIR
jgi:hypothetical protein